MSDLCKYVNNAYTDDAPYFAVMYIQHTDPTVVAAFQAFYPNGRQGLSPVMAAAAYGAGGPDGPFTTLPFLFINSEIPNNFAGSPPVLGQLDVNQPNATQLTSTVLDSCGNRVSYNWVLYLVLAGPTTVVATHENIMQRRWIQGFELPEGGEGGSIGSSLGNQITRDASRTPEGYGCSWRNRAIAFTMTVTEFTGGGASAVRGSWERLYVRVRGIPSGTPIFWRCRGSVSNTAGIALALTPTSNIQIINITNVGTQTVIGTSPISLALNTWYLLDIIPEYSSGAGGRFRLFANHQSQNDLTVAAISGGLGQTQFHDSSEVGNTTAGLNIEMDFDDWINAEVPLLFTGIDWLSGSHVVAHHPISLDASTVNWAGDFRTLIQNPAFRGNAIVSSSTASARLATLLDATIYKTRGWTQNGSPAFNIGIFDNNANATDGQLGYKIGAAADVLVTIDQRTTNRHQSMLYRPSLGPTTVTIEPLLALHTKSADGFLDQTFMLTAAAEYIGTFGAVDQASTTLSSPDGGIHNAPYVSPLGQWGSTGAPPLGMYAVMSGTYVGNGTGQDVNLAEPGHFLYVRPLTGSTGGGHWWTSLVGTHYRVDRRAIFVDQMVQMLVDTAGQAKFRVTGNSADCNAVGVVYQWVAVCDSGMRFMLNNAFMRDDTLVSAVNALIDSTFYAEASFLFQEQVGNNGVGISGHWYKGKGHSGARASLLDAAETTNVLTFGLGVLNSQSALHVADVSVGHSSWRIFDAPGTASGPATAHCDGTTTERAVAILSYTGDGTGARTIAVPLNNRFPLWAVVVPHNAGAFVRDPSHVSPQSSAYTLDGTSNTAITGGALNGIIVGATLNQNGIIYDVFVLPGATTGNADGWSANGDYYPVHIGPPCNGLWAGIPVPPPPPPGPGSACPDDFPVDLA